MHPLFPLFMTLLRFAFLCLFGAIIIVISDASKPKFYKLDQKIKKATTKFQKNGYIDITRLKKKIEAAFMEKKIDGMEREYLYQRIQVIESIIIAKGQPSTPKYAAGDEMDKISPRT